MLAIRRERHRRDRIGVAESEGNLALLLHRVGERALSLGGEAPWGGRRRGMHILKRQQHPCHRIAGADLAFRGGRHLHFLGAKRPVALHVRFNGFLLGERTLPFGVSGALVRTIAFQYCDGSLVLGIPQGATSVPPFVADAQHGNNRQNGGTDGEHAAPARGRRRTLQGGDLFALPRLLLRLLLHPKRERRRHVVRHRQQVRRRPLFSPALRLGQFAAGQQVRGIAAGPPISRLGLGLLQPEKEPPVFVQPAAQPVPAANQRLVHNLGGRFAISPAGSKRDQARPAVLARQLLQQIPLPATIRP
jgi:hypothetical protein